MLVTMKFYTVFISLCTNIFASGSLLSKNERDANGFRGRFDDVKTGIRVTDVTPYKTFRTKSAKRCIEHCLQHAQCKSTNMNEELGHCELLSISLNHDPSIGTTEENGWFYQGFVQETNPLVFQQQDTITAEEKEMCYQDQPDPDNLPEENYCVAPFFFDGKLHRSCSPQCQSLERIIVPLPPNTPTVCVTGGWMLIGHVNITSDSGTSQSSSDRSTDFNGLEGIAEGENKLLESDELGILYETQEVKEIRIYCSKPWHGRTIHLVLSKESEKGPEVFDYLGNQGDSISGFCPKPFRLLPDDNSYISALKCNVYGTGDFTPGVRLYDHWMFVGGTYHIMPGHGNRYECDDFIPQPGYTPIGVWNYYVR